MNILAIDYGDKKIGLALATSKIPQPYGVLLNRSKQYVVDKISRVIKKENIQKLLIGVSEGESKQKAQNFGNQLKESLDTEIEYIDETLSTYESQKLAINAGIKRKKRKNLKDAYAACYMLQLYLDRHV